jgi:acyl carrier protein
LFGKGSDLDSLGLVNFIVSVEENINNRFDVSISIVDEKAMSQKNSPFKSVDSLAEYILNY